MAAVTQIHHRHSDGRACYDKKLAEGKTPEEALRALKRQVSNAIFACLQADAARAVARGGSPGGQQGNDSVASAAGSHPRHRLFGTSHSRAPPSPYDRGQPRAAPASQEGQILPAP
jgi:transposase